MPRDSIVELGLHCCACGYDLHGIPPLGHCPECGTSVAASQAEGNLSFADEGWLRKLKLARWLPWAGLLAGVCPAAVMFVMEAVDVHRNYRAVVDVACLALIGLAALCVLFGCWCATAPNPAERDESMRSPRRLARAALLVCAVNSIVTIYCTLIRIPWGVTLVVNAVASPFGIAGAVAVWGLTHHYEGIARLAGDVFHGRRAAVYRQGYLASWTLTVVFTLSAIMAPCGAMFGLISGAMMLIFGLLVLLFPAYLIGILQTAQIRGAGLRARWETQQSLPGSLQVKARPGENPGTGDAADTSAPAA